MLMGVGEGLSLSLAVGGRAAGRRLVAGAWSRLVSVPLMSLH